MTPPPTPRPGSEVRVCPQCSLPLGDQPSAMVGRAHLDGGDRLAGRIDPPQRVIVHVRWGPGSGPRNVLICRPNGDLTVIPFTRRLRRLPPPPPEARA